MMHNYHFHAHAHESRLAAVQDLGLDSPASFFSISKNRCGSTRRTAEFLAYPFSFPSSLSLLFILCCQLVNMSTVNSSTGRKSVSRKEVFQPHLPVRLPCYDLAPITGFALGRSLRSQTSGTPGFHGLTGGVYKARERIHRAMADARLLANPASWGRVADPSPNWDRI